MTCTNKKCAALLPDDALFCLKCGRKQTIEPRKRIKRPNGAGTVYKLSGRRRRPWVAAKAGTIIGYYETKTSAQEALSALGSRPITERYNLTFKEVYELWKAEHFRKLTADGIEGYELSYKHFEALHDSRFRDLRAEDYQREIDKLIDKGRSHSTTNKLKQLAGQMSKWAMREEIISTNYASFIQLQENISATKETFTAADIKKLKACDRDEARIVLMLIYTGMRIGELFSLQNENVYDAYCIGGEKTDAGKNRIIPLPSDVRPYFAYFKGRAGDAPLLIDGYAGNRKINNFRRREYYDLLDELGIGRKSPHSTRHTYASLAVSSGMKPELLQKILGHADYSTTADIYVHADLPALIAAAERLAKQKKKV